MSIAEKPRLRNRDMRERRRNVSESLRAALLQELRLTEAQLSASQRLFVNSPISAGMQIEEAARCYTNGHLTEKQQPPCAAALECVPLVPGGTRGEHTATSIWRSPQVFVATVVTMHRC